MKNLQYLALTAAFLFVPAVALAEDTATTGADGTNSNVKTEVRAEKPRPPAPGQVLQNIKENANRANHATQERIDAAKQKMDDTRKAMEDRRAQVQTLINQKPRGGMSSTTAAELGEKRVEMRDKLEAKKANVQNHIEAAREKAKEKFSEAVQTSVNNITDRLTKAATHLASIADRIDARIKEYEDKGKDMSISVGLLSTARADIATAQDKITAVGAALTAALGSATPKTEMPKVRDAVRAAEEAIRTAKESLHKTLESTRTESQVKTEPAPTTN